MLEQHRDAEISTSSQLASKITKTIRGADLRLVKSDTPRRHPERILDNEFAGFVDRKGPAIIDF
jgi:hypothetical protein